MPQERDTAKRLRACYTHKLKLSRAYRRPGGSMPRLFNGAIHFIQVDFGGVKLSDADTSAAYQYSVLASPVLKAYCMQYGACSVNVDNRIYPFTWPSRTYSDSDLQNWVATLTSKFNFPSQDCLVFLSPPGATNTDAPYSSGILGYHNATGTHQPYIFVNVMGTGLVINDQADLFADALSHEIAEMIVDPLADLSNPETNDSCSGNCGTDNRNYFDAQGKWIGGGGAPGVGSPSTWSFYTNGVAAPYAVTSCPAPAEACRYDPNTPPSSPPPAPGPEGCIQQVKNGLANLEQGNLASGVLEILQGIECLFGSGFITESGQPSLDGRRVRLQLHKKPF